MKVWLAVLAAAVCPGFLPGQQPTPWAGYAHDAQHTGTSTVPTQSLANIHWSTPVDLDPPNGGGSGPLYIHYGTPLVTPAATVIVPVRTNANSNFELEAFRAEHTTLYADNGLHASRP